MMHWFRTFEQYAMKESTILFDTFFNLLRFPILISCKGKIRKC